MSTLETYNEYFYNDSLSLINENVFLYDIRNCYSRILKKLNINLGEFSSKKERNIKIGNYLKQNPKIFKRVREINKNSMINFIKQNNITEDDILFIEKDGLATTKYVGDYKNSDAILPELRNYYKITIKSISKRSAYLMLTPNKLYIKGVRFKTTGIEDYLFENLTHLLLLDYQKMFKYLNMFRTKYFSEDNLDLFKIPTSNGYQFLLKNDKVITVKNLNNVNLSKLNIDKYKYYKEHVETFIQSLVYEMR